VERIGACLAGRSSSRRVGSIPAVTVIGAVLSREVSGKRAQRYDDACHRYA
jgi:hypothetical protein